MLIGARRRWRAARRRGWRQRCCAVGRRRDRLRRQRARGVRLLGDNQDRTSRWSIPQRAADGDRRRSRAARRTTIVDYTRAAFAVAVRRRAARCCCGAPGGGARRPAAGSRPAGWATLGAAARVRVARALVRDLAAAAGGARPRDRRLLVGVHRAVRLHAGDRRAARAVLAVLRRELSRLSEFELLANACANARCDRAATAWSVGSGDDAAVVRAGGRGRHVASTRSWRASTSGSRRRRCATSGTSAWPPSLSDLAAMGAEPGRGLHRARPAGAPRRARGARAGRRRRGARRRARGDDLRRRPEPRATSCSSR